MPAGALLLLVVAVPQVLSWWPAVAPLQVADLVASIAVEPLRLVWICGRRWSSYSTRPHCWSAVELVAWPVVAVLHRAELLAGGRAVGLVSGRTAASGLAAAAELVAWPVVAVLHQAALLAGGRACATGRAAGLAGGHGAAGAERLAFPAVAQRHAVEPRGGDLQTRRYFAGPFWG